MTQIQPKMTYACASGEETRNLRRRKLPLLPTAKIHRVNLTEQIEATNKVNNGHCFVYGTDDITHYGQFTGRTTGKTLQDSHTKTPKRISIPGAQKHPQLETLLFTLNAVAILSLDPDYRVMRGTIPFNMNHQNRDKQIQ